MNNIFLPLFCVAGFLFLLGLAGVALAIWISRGESDVNGDPERDAGYTDAEIYAMERELYPPALSRSERELIHARNLN